MSNYTYANRKPETEIKIQQIGFKAIWCEKRYKREKTEENVRKFHDFGASTVCVMICVKLWVDYEFIPFKEDDLEDDQGDNRLISPRKNTSR